MIDVPSQSQASPAVRNSLHAAIRRFLHTLDEQTRAQFCWSVDSDYKDALAAYDKTTETTEMSGQSMSVPSATTAILPRCSPAQLRRERLVLYISRPIMVDPPATLSGERLTEALRTGLGRRSASIRTASRRPALVL